MVNKKILSLAILSVLVILSISMISAKTLVAGKLYNSDFSATIADTNVTVWCDSDSLNTISLADGTYAVVFNSNSCSVVTITTTAPNYMKVVMELPNEQTDDAETPSGSSNYPSGGKFYLCGNNVCDTGETANTCPEDCSVVEEEEEIEELVQELDVPENNQPNFLSKITGAVTGVLGSTKGIVIIVSILGLMIITIAIISFKKRKKVLE